MNEEFRFVVTSWVVLIVAIAVGTLFLSWLVEVVVGAWDLFIEHRREREIIQRMQKTRKDSEG